MGSAGLISNELTVSNLKFSTIKLKGSLPLLDDSDVPANISTFFFFFFLVLFAVNSQEKENKQIL